jgi:hypothetical protein
VARLLSCQVVELLREKAEGSRVRTRAGLPVVPSVEAVMTAGWRWGEQNATRKTRVHVRAGL